MVVRYAIIALVVCSTAMCADGTSAEFDPGSATFDQLMFHVARYGNTEEKREHKAAARKEMKARGAEALRYLVEHSHIKNMWFAIYARQLVEQLDEQEAVPVLLEMLDSPRMKVRKNAVYFLGFHEAPAHAARILPLLEDEDMAGVAIRTLGKWRVSEAVPQIVPFLKDEKERRRVLAANALRDIADPQSVAALQEARNDQFFTVRKAVARALRAISADETQ